MSDLREALQKMLIARADHKALSNLTGAQYDAALEAWMVRDAEAARAARAALSAEPAQEMTDEQIDAIKKSLTWWNGSHDMTNHRTFARAVIAADRASRLPEMGEGDWPELPKAAKSIPLGHCGFSFGPDGTKKTYDCTYNEDWYTADQLRAAMVAAVEAYKALVRGKT